MRIELFKQYLENLAAVYLLLGPACNMTCRHCSQTQIKNTFALKPTDELSPDILSFIAFWQHQNIKRPYSRVYFWGGEPLLYWNTIKPLVLKIEALGLNKNFQFRLFSNGLLLNDEIAHFCNEHRILFTMSYDAPNPLAVRNAVPSKENIESFMKIKWRSVNFVFNAINDNPVKAFDMLEEIFPETLVNMGLINVLNPIPEDIYNFKPGVIDKAITALADEILAGRDPYGNRYSYFSEKVWYLTSFDKEEFSKYTLPPCSPGFVSLSFKFKGDIVRCHNDNHVIANINDDYDYILSQHARVWKELTPERCYNCPAVSLCRNRCPIALPTKDKREFVHCWFLKQIYLSTIKCLLRLNGFIPKLKRDLRDELYK